MKKLLAIFLMASLLLSGCSKEIKAKKVIKTDFSKVEAELIMKRAWKPINDMKDENNQIKPKIKVASKEEFFQVYDFTYMDEKYMYDSIYESVFELVYHEEDGIPAETYDNGGNIIFKEKVSMPTIYDEGIYIDKAYLRDSKYSEKYSHLDIVELVVVENSKGNIDKKDSSFNRTNIFRKNEKEEWILYLIEGFISSTG